MGKLLDRLPTIGSWGQMADEQQAVSGARCREAGSGPGGRLVMNSPPLGSSVTALPAPTCPGWPHTEIVPEGQDAGRGGDQGRAAACQASSLGAGGAQQPPTPRRGHSGRGRAIIPTHGSLVLLFSSLSENATSNSSTAWTQLCLIA